MEASNLMDRLLGTGGWAARAVLSTSFLLPSASQASGLGVEMWLASDRGWGA